MGDRVRVELSTDGTKVHLMFGNRMVEELDADQAWDLGDDLIIMAGQLWLRATGKPWNPTWADRDNTPDESWLDEAATGQLFTPDELLALRALAIKQGLTVTQLLRQEVRATLEFAYWGHGSQYVPEQASDAQEDDPKSVYTDLQEIPQDQGDRPQPPPGGIVV